MGSRKFALIAGFVVASLLGSAPLSARQADNSSTSAHSKKSAKANKSSAHKSAHVATSKKRHHVSRRVQRLHQAFVTSASLKPMAQQLLQERTPAAYSGVTSYAQRHSKEDAGALAWLALGYAHILDHEYAKAIDPLLRARAQAGDLGDYVAYYLGSSYLQAGRSADSASTLATFDQTYPDSLLTKDAHVVYAGALISEGRAADAVTLL